MGSRSLQGLGVGWEVGGGISPSSSKFHFGIPFPKVLFPTNSGLPTQHQFPAMSCLLLSEPQDCLADSTGLCDVLAPLKTQHIGVPLSVPSTYPEKALHLTWVLEFTIKISFSTSLHDSLLPLITEHFACYPITIPFITDKHHFMHVWIDTVHFVLSPWLKVRHWKVWEASGLVRFMSLFFLIALTFLV